MNKTTSLPPLPEPHHIWTDDVNLVHPDEPSFTSDQMTAYAEQALEDFRADLAQALCDDCENGVKWLNEKAAERFKTHYPHLAAAMKGQA